MQVSLDPHFIVEIGGIVITAAVGYVGLVIKNMIWSVRMTMSQDKAELIKHNTEVKDELQKKHAEQIANQYALRADFDNKHAENKRVLDVHLKDDDRKFEIMTAAMQRIDQTLSALKRPPR